MTSRKSPPAQPCRSILLFGFAFGIGQALCAQAPLQHAPAAPDDYQLHAALELSLFAREPDIVDPVALTFDEQGRIYVVEMRDYPYGFGTERRPGGAICLLEDTDGDGKVDRSSLFATNLSFPTSIA